MASGANASQTSIKANADINTEESLSAYTGLAVNNATGHLGRINNMSEQILQNAITQAHSITTDSVSAKHKRTTDADTIAHFLDMQNVRGESLAQDRIWNIDEQIAAAEVLYAALGRFITSSKVEDPTTP